MHTGPSSENPGRGDFAIKNYLQEKIIVLWCHAALGPFKISVRRVSLPLQPLQLLVPGA